MLLTTVMMTMGFWGGGFNAPSAYDVGSEKIAPIVKSVKPSVVSIHTYGGGKSQQWCRVGTGFVFHRKGFIVTYASVIAGGDSIHVRFTDGRRRIGLPVGEDPLTKIALIKLISEPVAPLNTARLFSMDKAAPLFFIGNSVGVFPSVTLAALKSQEEEMLYLQASVPPGNCGGPLFTYQGELVGMVVGRYSEEGSGPDEGGHRGFAVPIHIVQKTARSLMERYNRQPGWIGITALNVPIDDESTGIKVVGLTRGGPAHEARICAGDTIVGLEGQPVMDVSTLAQRIRAYHPEQTVEINLKKGNSWISRKVQIAGHPVRSRPPHPES